MLIVLWILLSTGMTVVAHTLGLHGDLPHMQYIAWYEYVFESLFYMFFWFCCWYHFKQDSC